MTLAVVRGTMILATVAWASGEALLRRSGGADRLARSLSTTGLVLAVIHVVLAFEFVYAWNHEAAVEATARQSAERFGWAWRGGIYVNYLFLLLWLADVCWWWVAPASHAARPVQIESARLGLFLFMFLNGAVIFASGVGRLVGTACVVLVVASLARRRGWLPT
jgi:hypothetical protein